MDKYTDSARTVQDKDELIQSLKSYVLEKERMISLKEDEIQQLRQQLWRNCHEHIVRAYEQALIEKEFETQHGRVSQQLREAELRILQLEKRVAELEQSLGQRDQHNPEISSKIKDEITCNALKLKWRKLNRAPCGIFKWCDAVVDGNMVYISDGGTVNIYSYDSNTDSWSQLPDCVIKGCSITVINGWLTTVGGDNYSKLLSLTGEGNCMMWTEKYPPMPTRRWGTTVVCTGSTLIVAGGGKVAGAVLSTVEVMNTETSQWSTAADLPQPMYLASATVHGDCIYMLGGRTSTKSVYTCSVSALLQSCGLCSLESKDTKGASLSDQSSVWRQVADLPVTRATCESYNGQLLAVGGLDSDKVASTAVFIYNSATNSWEIVSHMTSGRCDCFTAVLPDNQLMVAGGLTTPSVLELHTDTVEVASVE